MTDTKNLLLATILSVGIIVVWQTVFAPEPPLPQNLATEQIENQNNLALEQPATQIAPVAQTKQQEQKKYTNIPVKSDSVTGFISTRGGRLSQLDLNRYSETLENPTEKVHVLTPLNSDLAYYVVYGWIPVEGVTTQDVPTPNTQWNIVGDTTTLTPDTPVMLQWDNGNGLVFNRLISLDEQYMFSIKQTVQNNTDAEVKMIPYGIVARHGLPEGEGFYILHEGGIGVLGEQLKEIDYDDIADLPMSQVERAQAQSFEATPNGWIGFTDKYWMTAMIAGNQPFTGVYKYTPSRTVADASIYQTDMRLPVQTVSSGQTASVDTNLFVGAKEVQTLRSYQELLNIDRFEDAVDWGWFFFLTKPIFWLLVYLRNLIGNMGVAIIALTFVIKLILFPLAYKSYVSMSKMKKLQPEMVKLKERAGDDKMKLQKEMMSLYKKEKVNPAAGCLPLLLQIPIFFSLYKVLFVTLEMRHAPFFGWIQDLSAPDPTSILNLFGLFPWDIPSFLGIISIGAWPIVMGITMWLQQRLNPLPTDPIQAQIFAWMPLIFMFMLGHFAAGLVIYWTANNILTFLQQYAIMRSQGVEVDLLGNIKSSLSRKKKKAT